jgi:hypothetical protein
MTIAVQPAPQFRRVMKANVSVIEALTPRQQQLKQLYMEQFKMSYGYRGLTPFPRTILDLTAETTDVVAAYREMLGDPFVKSGVFAKVFSVCAQDLNLTPADPENEASVAQAEMLKYAVTHCEGGFAGLAWTVLVGALIDGKSVAEKTNGLIGKGKWRGKVKLAKIKDKDPRYYRLIVDEFLNVTLVESIYGLQRQRFFRPKEDGLILYQHAKIYQNPHGQSDLRAAYRGWAKLQMISNLRMIGLDKYTGPFLKGTYSREDQQAAFGAALKQARGEGYITMPTGTEVEVLDLMARGTSDFASAERDAQQEILIGIMGAYLQQVEGTTPDGRGNSQVHQTTAELFQWYMGAALAIVLNEQVLPELTELNFGPDAEPPTAILGAINVQYLLQQLAVDEGLARLGLPLSKRAAYSTYQREPPKDAGDTLQPLLTLAPNAPAGKFAEPIPQAPAAGGPATPFRRLARSERWAGYIARR